jgi:hypothetical protein
MGLRDRGRMGAGLVEGLELDSRMMKLASIGSCIFWAGGINLALFALAQGVLPYSAVSWSSFRKD